MKKYQIVGHISTMIGVSNTATLTAFVLLGV